MTATSSTGSADEALTAEELLTLERIGETSLRSVHNQENRAGAIFGGQPLAQALSVAQATVPGWPAHSLSANFMRSGNFDLPVDYEIELLRDGRRYAARRVLASQQGKPIFDCICSFHDPEESAGHQVGGIEDVPPPESLVDMREFARAHSDEMPAVMWRSLRLPFPIEIRMIDPQGAFVPGDTASRDYWLRVPSAGALGDDMNAHQCILAFASDYWIAGAAAIPHPPTAKHGMTVASLNHAMWFHTPTRVDEWLLYRTSSPWTNLGRGLALGQIYDRAGALVASVAQEASLRQIRMPAQD